MKKLIAALLLATATLVGCGDGLTNKQETCLEHMEDAGRTDGWEVCVEGAEYREHEKAMARIENYSYKNVSYAPVQPNQNYVDYYGNEQYGYWDNGGIFRFNDPYSSYAQSTNSYLLAAGLGGLAGYVASNHANRNSWRSENSGGWSERTTTSTKYIGKGGKEISKAEYDRRKAQSAKDKKAYQTKLKKENASLKKQLANKNKNGNNTGAKKTPIKQKAKVSTNKKVNKPQKPKINTQKKPLNLNKPKPTVKKKTTYKPKSKPRRKSSRKKRK